MPLIPYKDRSPDVAESTWVAPNAWITGDCKLAENVSVFFGAVMRGDINQIRVGKGTNIQEHAMLHTSHGLGECIVGENVTVGHRAIIHGATVQDNCIIGMGATILDGAIVGKNSIIGAQALVPMNMEIPENSLAVGVPAKVIKEINPEQLEEIKRSAEDYVSTGQNYKEYFEKN